LIFCWHLDWILPFCLELYPLEETLWGKNASTKVSYWDSAYFLWMYYAYKL
jgi:hypothetical protein